MLNLSIPNICPGIQLCINFNAIPTVNSQPISVSRDTHKWWWVCFGVQVGLNCFWKRLGREMHESTDTFKRKKQWYNFHALYDLAASYLSFAYCLLCWACVCDITKTCEKEGENLDPNHLLGRPSQKNSPDLMNRFLVLHTEKKVLRVRVTK